MTPFTHPPKNEGCAHPSDRATRASHQAPTGLDHTASVPCAFTPGPWSIIEGDSVVRVVADGGSVVATDTRPYYEPFDATDLANARLIAAAPDMFEALERATKMIDSANRSTDRPSDYCFNVVSEFNSILAKARGEHS